MVGAAPGGNGKWELLSSRLRWRRLTGILQVWWHFWGWGLRAAYPTSCRVQISKVSDLMHGFPVWPPQCRTLNSLDRSPAVGGNKNKEKKNSTFVVRLIPLWNVSEIFIYFHIQWQHFRFFLFFKTWQKARSRFLHSEFPNEIKMLRTGCIVSFTAQTAWLPPAGHTRHNTLTSLLPLLTDPLKLASTKKTINILFMSIKKNTLSICF